MARDATVLRRAAERRRPVTQAPLPFMSASSTAAPRSIGLGRPALLFWTLMLGLMSQGFAFTAFVAALPQMAAEFGSRGAFVAQMTMGVASLGLMVGALASGWVLERVGTRVLLLVSTLLYGVAGAGGLVLHAIPLLLLSRFAVGLAAACMVTTCLWGIGAAYEGARRARVLGYSSALANAISLVGTLLGGALAQLGGWRLAFIQFPVFGVVGALLGYLSLRQVKPERPREAGRNARILLRLVPFYLLATLLFAVIFLASTQFAFLLQLDGVNSASIRSLFIGAMTVVATLTAFCYGTLQQRLSTAGVFALGLASMAAALELIGCGPRPAYAAAGAVLMGIYVGTIGPYVYHFVTERTDEAARGRAVGFLNAACFLGGFLNPPMFAVLARVAGPRGAFVSTGLLIAALAAGTLLRKAQRRAMGPETAA